MWCELMWCLCVIVRLTYFERPGVLGCGVQSAEWGHSNRYFIDILLILASIGARMITQIDSDSGMMFEFLD